jgi:predicted TIM-barrel fold metal-dependent hydrolase
MSGPCVVISADCHAGGTWAAFREYLEPRHGAAFDAWCAAAGERQRRLRARMGGDPLAEEFRADFAGDEHVRQTGLEAARQSERRLHELELDGVVGEVIYPDAGEAHKVPFGGGLQQDQEGEADPARLAAGARAYNRWLAEFCAQAPERRAGIAVLTLHDIDAAVREVRWARSAGLRGGVLIPAGVGDLPFYHHPRYEPLWAVCAELDMPVNCHSGSGTPDYGAHRGSSAIWLSEIVWYARRPLTFLLWSGVFERHPTLKFVLSEQNADWAPYTIQALDRIYERPMFAHVRKELPLRPSEYWRRCCFIGASMLSPLECSMREEIGVGNLMWGSDYPHAEGTWPHSRDALRETFRGVPVDEVRAMLGGNAARVYGFDLAKLAPIAARVGPAAAELEACA